MDDFDLYRLFKTLHVLGVIMLGGAIAIESVAGPLMQKAGSVQELRAYTRAGVIAENFLQLPAFVILVIAGYATADRAGIALDTTWLLISQALAYFAVAVALLYLRRAMFAANKAAEAAPDGPVTPELQAMVNDPKPAALGGLLLIIFIAIVYLMVAKPAW